MISQTDCPAGNVLNTRTSRMDIYHKTIFAFRFVISVVQETATVGRQLNETRNGVPFFGLY